MSSILPGILLLKVIKICDNLYISRNHIVCLTFGSVTNPTLVLLTFSLDPSFSLAWLDMNELKLEGRKTSSNCLSEISFYLSQGYTVNHEFKALT